MDIKDILNQKAAISIAEATNYNPNLKVIGKAAIVNRVRGGKVELRKERSEAAGYKISQGQIVKMTPEEVRRRKIAAKISARKRRAEMSKILRRRSLSLKVRASRLG